MIKTGKYSKSLFMNNSKNELHELVKELGFRENVVTFSSDFDGEKGLFVSRVILNLNEKGILKGIGSGNTKKSAEKSASQNILDIVYQNHTDLLIDWNEVKKEAQLGDALIKLNAYLSSEIVTAEDKSMWLQKNETDKHLGKIFDNLKEQNHDSVALFGNNLGAKRKATWIEALIWRKFGKNILAPSANQEFIHLTNFLKQ